MNAPNSPPDKKAAERRAYEPSMEEILASIRRIIADDQALSSRRPPAKEDQVPSAPPAPPPEPAPEPEFQAPEPDFMSDDEYMDVSLNPDEPEALLPSVPQDEPSKPRLNENFALRPIREEPERPVAAQMPPSPFQAQLRNLQSDSDIIAEFENEAQMRHREREFEPEADVMPAMPVAPYSSSKETKGEDPLVSPSTDASVASAFSTLVATRFLQSDDTIGDMVREMVRPMLKTWLDDNLPILVERLVRAEIERVARGGR